MKLLVNYVFILGIFYSTFTFTFTRFKLCVFYVLLFLVFFSFKRLDHVYDEPLTMYCCTIYLLLLKMKKKVLSQFLQTLQGRNQSSTPQFSRLLLSSLQFSLPPHYSGGLQGAAVRCNAVLKFCMRKKRNPRDMKLI